MKNTNLDKKKFWKFSKVWIFSEVPKFGYFQRSPRTHFIHQPLAMSCMMQQLLLHYQIPQYDRRHLPVTGILLIVLLFIQDKR